MAGQAFSHRHQEFIRFLNTVEAYLNILDGTVIGRNMQREPKASLQGRRRCRPTVNRIAGAVPVSPGGPDNEDDHAAG